MHIVHVSIEVLPGHFEAFRAATYTNVEESRKEPGVVRFDFYGEEGEPAKFLLIEIYRDAEAAALHKQTTHYQAWRDTVAPMMHRPRTSVRYLDLLSFHEL